MKSNTRKNNFIKPFLCCASTLIWLCIWQFAAMAIDKEIFLPTPVKVITVLVRDLLPSNEFWCSVLASISHICLGFFLGCAFGILLAIIASLSSFMENFLGLPIRVLKSVPVASFVILTLLWFDADDLSIFIPAIVVLPMLYINTLTGIKETNGKLIEMANIFRISFSKRISHIYIPNVLPYILSASSLATGMAWKSGIAAEIIGLAKDSIGNELYQTKIYLMIPELFAWTVVIIILSLLFETIVKSLIKLTNRGA
ncbi:MAG: ABC transporter permease subunit [Lachnospiraceae bacterium]|nr:ABC transporter permease subunit [Lachnospiraceae bacterium]